MVDMSAVGGLAASLKAASEIMKAMIGLRDAALIQEKVIELQRVILSAHSDALASQMAHFALLDEVRGLKETVAKFEKWDAEKEKYHFQQIYPGAFAYTPKPDASGSEPMHWICAACYQNHKKSVLQLARQDGREKVWKCPSCKNEIRAHYTVKPDKPYEPAPT